MIEAPRDEVRPMLEADLDQVIELSARAFGIALDDPSLHPRWGVRLQHCLRTDPAGGFVAVDGGRIAGVAQAVRREGLWILSLLAVDPQAQSRRLGRRLFAAALDYARPDDAGLIISSNDPRAMTLYGLAGFELRPAFEARGRPDLAARPASLPELTAGPGEPGALGAISRAVRGASHDDQLALAFARGAEVLRLEDRGYTVILPGQGVWLLAALDEEAATALLWGALAALADTDQVAIRWMTGAQQWAIRVVLAAGLRICTYGAVCLRGLEAPLWPYLPSPPFG